ncbi:hypothetical protein DO021_19560 [Desulfobacter hydrogenophilus]|uniref:Uncharacterized protein n=1 Tax=Desulfobacter hydrogenophilus TaxID=2291 RepID=A0A328F7Z0_9BACT|nr:hypothetical protein [Desulfobacter hydrogenophilus]NDY73968.1 hypothetical protein [Desulfobacter hydrogenophilus]QBH14314.1 hypothetical protein EYB58_16160 [Desulfobacter hydrogenophilus]RAM00316.1 hypothetical protein DO021_19560 [Desulfobacter hydrogenophilus]
MADNSNNYIMAAAIGLNLIIDTIDRVKTDTGIEITPETIAVYVSMRNDRRHALNQQLGISEEGA